MLSVCFHVQKTLRAQQPFIRTVQRFINLCPVWRRVGCVCKGKKLNEKGQAAATTTLASGRLSFCQSQQPSKNLQCYLRVFFSTSFFFFIFTTFYNKTELFVKFFYLHICLWKNKMSQCYKIRQ